MQKKRAHDASIRVLIRAALVAALATLLAVAASCSSTPSAAPAEVVASAVSGLTSCGAPVVHHATAGTTSSPGTNQAYAPSKSFVIPAAVQATGAMWYPNATITATLVLTAPVTITCTYQKTLVPQTTPVDIPLQSCTGGKTSGDYVVNATGSTLSGLITNSASGTAGLDATLAVTVDDANPCTIDSCGANGVTHSYAAEGTSCDTDGTVCNGTATCAADGTCTGPTIPFVSDDGDACTVESLCDAVLGVTHTYSTALCPPPANVPPVPASNPTVPSDFSKNVEYIYTGASPAQIDVVPGKIQAKWAAVLTGRVLTSVSDPPLPVTVTVVNHPEYGSTTTRSDGRFEMVVNGGEAFVVQYARPGYLTVQRRTESTWHDWSVIPDSMLTGEAAAATTTFVSGDPAWHTVIGPTSSDLDGPRTPVLIVPGGTSVTGMTGQNLTFHMTEYTVGANGPAAMPGTLPPQSAYTYAIEMRVENAPQPTQFSTPVIFYVDNFNGTTLGETVPNGYYDRTTGVWKGEETGKVVQVLGVTGTPSAAILSYDGNVAVADGTDGITLQERQQLASAYSGISGKQFWRVRFSHFSPEDLNWGAPPPDAEFPGGGPPISEVPVDDAMCVSGSIIECENSVLRESIPLTGVPFGLHYRSEGQAGAKTVIKVPYAGPNQPVNMADFLGAEVTVTIQGRSYGNGPVRLQWAKNAMLPVEWDRRDRSGFLVQGTVTAGVRVAWVYKAKSGRTSAFGRTSGTQGIVGNRIERVIKMEKYYSVQVGAFDPQPAGLGGWSVGLQHVYDKEHGIIWRGDGTKVDLNKRAATAWTEVPAQPAGRQFQQMAIGPDGREFVWYRSTLYEVVGSGLTAIGAPNPTVDGCGSASNPSPQDTSSVGDLTSLSAFTFNTAGFAESGASAFAGIVALPKDEFLIGTDFRIWRVASAGASRAVTLVAGVRNTGSYTAGTFAADGAPALGAALPSVIKSLAVGPDGSIYYVDYMTSSAPFQASRIRRILPNGTLETLVGTTGANSWATNVFPSAACWSPTSTCTALGQPMGGLGNSPLAVDPKGNVYFASEAQLDVNHVGGIWKMTPMGQLSLVAGLANGAPITTDYREGEQATSVPLKAFQQASAVVTAMAWYGGSLFYIEAVSGTVRRIDPDGRSWIVAGGGSGFASGADARLQGLGIRNGLAIGPDGYLHMSVNAGGCSAVPSIVRVQLSNVRQLSNGDSLIPSDDGSEVYRFDSSGRHQETLSGLRGKSRWQFFYDGSGRLTTVRDSLASSVVVPPETGVRRDTVISYGGTGYTITGPWGHVNTVTVTNGYLSNVAEPETSFTAAHSGGQSAGLLLAFAQTGGSQHTFSYDSRGWLVNDKNGLGGSPGITLQRTEGLTATTIALTTAEGRTTTHVRDSSKDPNDTQRVELRRHIDPNNLETTDARYVDGSRKVTLPDGTSTTSITAPDPRYGVAAPYVKSSTIASGTKSVTATQAITTVVSTSDPRLVTKLTSTRTVNALNTVTEFTDDGTNPPNVVTTSPVGRKSKVILDAQDRVVRVEPQGSLPALNGTTVTPLPIDIAYDSVGRVGTVTQGARTTIYGYEALTGFLSSVVGPMGGTSYTYQRQDGLPNQVNLPGSRTVKDFWDIRGNLTSVQVPRDVSTWYSHGFGVDNLDRVSSYQPPNAGFSPKDSIYNYDKESSPLSVSMPSGVVLVDRDQGGRPIKLTFPEPVTSGTRTIETTYDKQRVNTIASKLNGVADATLTYGYDGLMQTSEQLVVQNVAANPVTTLIQATVGKSYDSLMRPSVRSLGGLTASATLSYDNDSVLSSVLMNGMTYTLTRETVGNAVLKSTGVGVTNALAAVTDKYEYDAYGSPVHYSVQLSGVTVYDVIYDRSPATGGAPNTGRIKSKTETINGVYGGLPCTTSYTYSASNFLESSARTGACSGATSYTYDLAGNRTAAGHVYDAQDRLTNDGQWVYKYTNEGDIRALSDGTNDYHAYTTDLLGNLRRKSGLWSNDIRYIIDGLGRRVARTNATGGLLNGYIWDGSHIVGETNVGGVPVAHYVYATRPNVPDLLVRWDQNQLQLKTYRLISDIEGSPKLLIRLSPGGGGAILERYDWDDWGVATVTWPTAFHPFGFAGGLWDADVGNYRYGARDYNPWKGRWWSKDPSGFGGGANHYTYADNDPINFVDSTGRLSTLAIPAGLAPIFRPEAAAVTAPGVGAIAGLLAATGVWGGLYWAAYNDLFAPNAPADETQFEGGPDALLDLGNDPLDGGAECKSDDRKGGQFLYHYTSYPIASFAGGLYRDTSATDRGDLRANEARSTLGLHTLPDKVLIINNSNGYFVPNRPFYVQPTPGRGFVGGGTDYRAVVRVPPSAIVGIEPVY